MDAAPWEISSTALITALAIWGVICIAGRLYSRALLRFGGRAPLGSLRSRTPAA